MNAKLMREVIDARVRPGQAGGTLTVDRLPSRQALIGSRSEAGNRYDWTEMVNVVGALYRRTRYGTSRYLVTS